MSKVSSIIEEGIQQGQLREMDAKFATFMIFSSMRWLFNLTTDNKDINPIEIEKQLNDFIFCGINTK